MKPNRRRVLSVVAGVVVAGVLALGGQLFAALSTINLTIVTPSDIATELVGPGILSISNVTYTGATPSAGKFLGGTGIIGFESGVILSTGNISNVPLTGVNQTSSGANLNGNGDADLAALSGGQVTKDATGLEFDFVPDKSKVFIQYVFGSEEYREFVYVINSSGKSFNDVFAFYVNGLNCATVGGLAVSINTINNGSSRPPFNQLPASHPELFVDNDVHPVSPLATQMDGLTKVLTCQAPVNPNVTNHIKLAIADVGDGSQDSVVFLRSASFTTTPPLTILKKTNNTNNDVEPAPLVSAGAPVRWTYDVTNSGNDPLTSVTVTDNKLGAVGCPKTALTAGETMTCIVNSTAVPGDYVNIGTVVGTSSLIGSIEDTNPDRYFGAQPAIEVVTKTNHTNNDDAPGPFVVVGSTIVWTYEVKNTGNVPLSGVTVTDSKGVPVDCSLVPGGPAKTTLSVGETAICSATGTAETGPYANIGSASGSIQVLTVSGAFEVVTVSDTDPDHYSGVDPKLAIIKKTNGTDANGAPGPLVLAGDEVRWTYVVTNTGNVALSDVAITDDKEGPICVIGALAVGETAAACSKSSIAHKGEYINTATATGKFGPVLNADGTSGNFTATATDTDRYFGVDPKLAIVKKTNGRDSNSPPGPSLLVGDPVTWTYLVTNTGNVTLTNIAVTDDKEGSICTIATLPVGHTDSTCAKSVTARRGDYTNEGTASGKLDTVAANGDTKIVTFTASDVDHYFGIDPRVRIIKTTNGIDSDVAPGPFVLVGDQVLWTYLVTNTGNVPLTDIAVTDDKEGPICTIADLAVGETAPACTKSATALKGQYTNTGTASTKVDIVTSDGQTRTVAVIDHNLDHYFGADPKVAIVKKTNGVDGDLAPGPFILVGDPVIWTYVVTNMGNVPLTAVAVTDDKEGLICTIGVLAAGSTASTCTKGTTAQNGQYANTGTTSGTLNTTLTNGQSKIVTVTADNVDHYFGAEPKLDILKTTNGTDNDAAPGHLVLVGDPVTWSYAVTNTGNVPLANVAVVDDKEGAICTIGVLAAGQTAATCTKTAPARKGQYTNVGSTNGELETVGPGGQVKTVGVTADNIDHYFGADPRVALAKKTNGVASESTPGPFVLVGDPVVWSYVVTNTGNVTLTDLVVTDDPVGSICQIDSLLPEETRTCTKASTAVRGQYTNTGSVRATAPIGPPLAVHTVAHYFGIDPKIAIVKKTNGTDNDVAPGPSVLVGSAVTWTYVVTNTGNVPLTNVAVTDDKAGDVCAIGPLAVDETRLCTKTAPAVKGLYENTGTVTSRVEVQLANGEVRTVTPTASNVDHYFGANPKLAIVKKTITTSLTHPPHDPHDGCDGYGDHDAPWGGSSGRHDDDDRGYGKNGKGDDKGRYDFGRDPKKSGAPRTIETDNVLPPGPLVPVGTPIAWSYTVTNTGNVPLTDVVITDDKEGPVCVVGALAIGQTARCVKNGIAKYGQYENTGTAAGIFGPVFVNGNVDTVTVTASDLDHYFGARPAVAIVKKTNGTNNDEEPGLAIFVGKRVTWTYEVTNTGNIPLTDLAVTDDKVSAISCMATTWPVPSPDHQGGSKPPTWQPDVFGDRHWCGQHDSWERGDKHERWDSDDRGSWDSGNKTWGFGDKDWSEGNSGQGGSWGNGDNHESSNRIQLLAPGATVVCSATGKAIEGQYENTGSVSASSQLGSVRASNKDHYFGIDSHTVYVIGDKDSHHIGDRVHLSGAEWWKNNHVSGWVAPGTGGFKGRASDVDVSSEDCGCGGTWSAHPDRSSRSSDRIPRYVAVVVTDSVVKNGSDYRGKIKEIVVVKPDSGYSSGGPDLGKGRVFSVLCKEP